MPIYDLTSSQTGRTYQVDFASEPNDADVDEAIAYFDSQEPAAPEAAPAEQPGFIGQMGESLMGGGQLALGGGRTSLGVLTGDVPGMAAGLTQMQQAQARLQASQTPEDVAFAQDIAQQAQEMEQAEGFFPTLREAVDLPLAVARRPVAALRTAVQSLPNIAVTTPVTLAGAALGGVAGAAAGLPTTGPGAVLTGLAGAATTGAAANAAIEVGYALNDLLNERTGGASATMTEEQIAAYLEANPDIVDEAQRIGLTRGATIGAVEALGLKGAGRLTAAPARAAEQAARTALAREGVDLASQAAVRQAMATPALRQAAETAAKAATDQFNLTGRALGAVGIEAGTAGGAELLAQKAAGQELDYGEAFLETLGEGLAAPASVLGARRVEMPRGSVLNLPAEQAVQTAAAAMGDEFPSVEELTTIAGPEAASQVATAVADAGAIVPPVTPVVQQAQVPAQPASPAVQPVAVDVANQPSPNLAPRATENAQARPVRQPGQNYREFKDQQDEWDNTYGRTHNEDGTPYQPTVLDETVAAVTQDLASASIEDRIDAVGTDIGIELGTGLTQLLNDGWVWDAQQRRMVDPQNRGESPRQALTRIRGGAAPAAQPAPAAPAAPATQPAAPRTRRIPVGDGTFIEVPVRETPTPTESLPAVEAQAAAPDQQPAIQTPDETEIPEASGLPPVQSQPPVPEAAVNLEEGTALGGGQGQEGQVNVPPVQPATAAAPAQPISPLGEVTQASEAPRRIIRLGRQSTKALAARDNILANLGQETDLLNEVETPDGALIQIQTDGDDVRLSSIYVPPSKRGRGIATKTISDILREAQANGVSVYLTPSPFGEEGGLSSKDLEQLYRKLGFVDSDKSSSTLVYRPTQPPVSPATGTVPTETLPADTQPTSGDVGTVDALRAVATNTATPEQLDTLTQQGLARVVQGQPVITDAGVAMLPEGERPRLTEAERVAEIEGQATETSDSNAEINDAIESGLTDSEKSEAAQNLGESEWNEKTRSKFKQALVDWSIGIKSFSSKLVELFKKVLRSGKSAILSAAFFIGPVNVTTEGVAFVNKNPETIPVLNVAQQITETQDQIGSTAQVDFRNEVVSEDVRTTANWILQTGDNKGKAFLVADKTGGQIYVFNGAGVFLEKSPALYGENVGDTALPLKAKMEDLPKTTPSGRFEGVPYESKMYGDTVNFYSAEQYSVAIHKLYLDEPSERRAERLESDSPADNRISWGCINVSEGTMFDFIKFAFEKGGVVYVLPETEQGRSVFPPLGGKAISSQFNIPSSDIRFSTNTPATEIPAPTRPLTGDAQRNETMARRRRGKPQLPTGLRTVDGAVLPGITPTLAQATQARTLEAQQTPGAQDTWIGTSEEYLAENPDATFVRERRDLEAFYDGSIDRAVILTDRVQVREGDAVRAARNGTSAGLEAVRRLIRHEAFVHRGWRALPKNLKDEFLSISENVVPADDLDQLAKIYKRFANWRNDSSIRALAVEEWLAQRLERIEKLPAGSDSVLNQLVDWAKRVWQWLNGNDAVEPTRAELVDVMRQMIRALETGEKEAAARGAVMASLTDTDAAYMDALQGDNGNDNLTEQLRAASKADRQKVLNDWIARNPQSAATLQQRVNEAARAIGYDAEVFHGTDAKNQIGVPKINFREDSWKQLGIHVGSREAASNRENIRAQELAREGRPKQGAWKIMPLFLKGRFLRLSENRTGRWGVDDVFRAIIEDSAIGKQMFTQDQLYRYFDDELLLSDVDSSFDFDSYGIEADTLWHDATDEQRATALIAFFQKNGYDGIEYDNEFEGGGTSYLVLSPAAIKSADPVTYDDNGNVIPPSQRFQPESPDIRFSLTGNEAEIERIIREDRDDAESGVVPTRARPLAPGASPTSATEQVNGQEIIERNQLQKTSLQKTRENAIKIVDALGPMDTWLSNLLNPAWQEQRGFNIRSPLGQYVIAEALNRVSNVSKKDRLRYGTLNDLLARQWQTGSTESATTLAARSGITSDPRYAALFTVQAMLEGQRKLQAGVIDPALGSTEGTVAATLNVDTQAQQQATEDVDSELRLKDMIYDLGLASQDPDVIEDIKAINENIFRVGVLMRLREKLANAAAPVSPSMIEVSSSAVEAEYAGMTVEQIDALINGLNENTKMRRDRVLGKAEQAKAKARTTKPKGTAKTVVEQAKDLIEKLEAAPGVKKTPKPNPVRDLYKAHLKQPMAEGDFVRAMVAIGVPEAEARKLYGLAAVKIAAAEAVAAQKESERQAREADKPTPAEAFAARTINEVANRLADPAATPAEKEQKVLPIRELYKEHVRDGLPLDVFVQRAVTAGLDEQTAFILHGVGTMERYATETRRGYNEAGAAQRFAERVVDEAAKRFADPSLPQPVRQQRRNAIRELYRNHTKNPMPFDVFVEAARRLGVDERTAATMHGVGTMENEATLAIRATRQAGRPSPTQAFATRTINEAADRLADPASTPAQKQQTALPIRTLYREHLDNGLDETTFIERATALGLDSQTAFILYNVGVSEREAVAIRRGYNEAGAAQRFAERVVDEAAARFADPALPQPVRTKRKNAIRELYAAHVKKPMGRDAFVEAARKLGVDERTAATMHGVGTMENEARAIQKDARNAEAEARRLNDRTARLLDTDKNSLENLINKLRPKITGGLNWREIFDRPLTNQREWRQQLFDTLRADPALANLSPAEVRDLAAELDRIWNAKREAAFKVLAKRMNLPGAREGVKEKIAESAPALIRYINSGAFNDVNFRNAIADKFGVPQLDEARVDEVIALVQKAQEAKTQVERNKYMNQAIRLMQEGMKAELGEVISNYWVTSVLSGFATLFDMAMSVLNGARVMTQFSADAIIRQRDFKLAGRAAKNYFQSLGNAILESSYYFVSGDPTMLDNYQFTLNTYLREGSAAANPFDYFERIIKDPNKSSWKKIVPYYFAGLQRLMTAFDHINSTSTAQGTLEHALAYNRKLFGDARMPSEQDVAAARAQAVELAGGDRTYAQRRKITAYTRQILNEEFNKNYPGILDEAKDIGRIAAYQNDPTGIGGLIYHTLLGLTNKAVAAASEFRDEGRALGEAQGIVGKFMREFMYILAVNSRNISGTRFVRFVGNRVNELISFTPGVGFLRLYEKDTSPTRRAMLLQNQTVGMLLGVWVTVTLLRMMGDEEDDEKRGFRVSGSWQGLTPDRKNQLRANNMTPNSVQIWDGEKWVNFNYTPWPVASLLATVGNLADMKKYHPEKWDAKSQADRILAAAWAGAFSFKDLSAISGFMDMLGASAYSTDPVDSAIKWLGKFSSNYVGGVVPRMLKDIDMIMDPKARKPTDVIEHFVKELPFFRRLEIGGEKMYNIFGEQVELSRLPWRRVVTASRPEREYQILAELNNRGLFLGVANPDNRTVGYGASRRELTDEEAERYSVETGKRYRQFILDQGERLLEMPEERAKEFISRRTEALRNAALRDAIRTQL